MDDLYSIPAVQRRMLLESMLHSPAFALFCDRWNEGVKDLDATIFDPKTGDEETRQLKRVRQQLVGTKHPRAILETMIRSTNNERPRKP